MIIGFEVLGLGVLAAPRPPRPAARSCGRRSPRSLLVGFQAWLGRETVRLGNSGESVTAHLAAAMTLVGLLVYILVRCRLPGPLGGRGASQRFTLLAAFGGRGDLRAAAVRLARHRDRRRARLPGLAADERHAVPAADRR